MPPHPHSTSKTGVASYSGGSRRHRRRACCSDVLRLEDIAIEDRRNAKVRHVDQLRDIQVDGDAHQRVGLLDWQAECKARLVGSLYPLFRAARTTPIRRPSSRSQEPRSCAFRQARVGGLLAKR
jgi:hypothetical protein